MTMRDGSDAMPEVGARGKDRASTPSRNVEWSPGNGDAPPRNPAPAMIRPKTPYASASIHDAACTSERTGPCHARRCLIAAAMIDRKTARQGDPAEVFPGPRARGRQAASRQRRCHSASCVVVQAWRSKATTGRPAACSADQIYLARRVVRALADGAGQPRVVPDSTKLCGSPVSC